MYTKEDLERSGEVFATWQLEAFRHFKEIVVDKEDTYPCILGRKGFLGGHLRFGFFGDPREDGSIQDLATVLKQYGEISRETGSYASFIAFFETPVEMKENYTIQEYEDVFWSALNRLTEHDSMSWPPHISEDPAHHSWEFCIHNEPYFSFCSTPAHKERRSRYFPFFMMAFQPRWVFEGMNDSTAFGRNVKKEIRKRLEQYDHIDPHPDLKWYGQEDNLEWKQYFLRDDSTSLSKCPFHKAMDISRTTHIE